MADQSTVRDIEKYVLGEVWTSDEIYTNLRYICDDLGSRFGGSESEHQAGQFLLGKMKEYGLQNAHLEEFPVYTWERGTCELTMLAPLERTFSAISMPFTGSGVIEGEMIDIGEGETADFERAGEAIRGKIILTAAETNKPGEVTLHRTDKFRLAVAAGAIGCIFVNKNPGMLHITGSLYAQNPQGGEDSDHESAIPGIGINHESGSMIRRLAERGAVRMKIHTENKTYLSRSYNVIGDIPGQHPEEIVLMGGHYDGHDVAQGAADDGAGTLVGLEAGRVLAPFAGQMRRTVRVICFAYEELGLGGSWKHHERYLNGNEKLVIALNLDGAGREGTDQITVTGDETLTGWFRGLSGDLKHNMEVRNRVGTHSDHFPFFRAGFPTATLNTRDSTVGMIGRGYGHTEADTVDKVTLRGLQGGAATAARVAAYLATVEPFPVERRDMEVVIAELEKAGQGYHAHHWSIANRVL